MAIEKTPRVEPDAPITTTVVLDRSQPDYLGSFDPGVFERFSDRSVETEAQR